MSSTSCVICGRFPLLPPRLILEEVELELKPESGTGDDWYSRRKSKPPASRKGGDKEGMHCWASITDEHVCQAALFRVSRRNLLLGNMEKTCRTQQLSNADGSENGTVFLNMQNPIQNKKYQSQVLFFFFFNCTRATALEKQMFQGFLHSEVWLFVK